jgi:mannose-6-phosphate isomerase-like protein (cupin superfamily)
MGNTTKRGLVAGIMLLAGVCMGSVLAEERAFTWTADDPNLEWGACPDFLPDECRLAVLQGNPEQRNADVFLRLPGNSEAAHHWHTSAERMVLISGEFHVDYDGQDPVVMRPGTYAYGPARLPHSAACRSSDACVLFIAFEEPVDAVPTEQ